LLWLVHKFAISKKMLGCWKKIRFFGFNP